MHFLHGDEYQMCILISNLIVYVNFPYIVGIFSKQPKTRWLAPLYFIFQYAV